MPKNIKYLSKRQNQTIYQDIYNYVDCNSLRSSMEKVVNINTNSNNVSYIYNMLLKDVNQ